MPKKKNPIRQRKKGDPIAADLEAYGSVEINGSPEAFRKMYFEALADPETFGKRVFLDVLKPVYQQKIAPLDYPP
ncbi:MAG: hypothetical protein K9M82_00770, partial [Deltaproteobacteria bacterium]|nr:hypothetical protein [Deltaproteobacteria bacterium]